MLISQRNGVEEKSNKVRIGRNEVLVGRICEDLSLLRAWLGSKLPIEKGYLPVRRTQRYVFQLAD